MKNEEYFSQIRQEYQEAIAYITEHSAEWVRQLGAKLNEILAGKVADFGNGGVMFYDLDNIDELLCVDITNQKAPVTEGKITYVYGDFYDFDFPSDLDFSLAQMLLHHLTEDERLDTALRRLNIALGSRGKFVIVEMVMPAYMESIQNILRPVLDSALRMMNKPELRFFSFDSLSRTLKKAGFNHLTAHNIKVVGWTAPAPALFPKLKMPGWLYPLRCVVIEASS